MKAIPFLVVLGVLLFPLASAQATDISPIPSIHVGYLWTRDSGGPAVALPWTLQEWKLKFVTAAVTTDVLFGGVTTVANGSVPAAAGAGITLSDLAKRVHAAGCLTTSGKVAGFLGVQVFGLPSAAALVGNRLVPQDGLMVGYTPNGLSATYAKTWAINL